MHSYLSMSGSYINHSKGKKNKSIPSLQWGLCFILIRNKTYFLTLNKLAELGKSWLSNKNKKITLIILSM